MKILTVIPQGLLAGAPIAALRLGQELAHRGHQLLALPCRPGPLTELIARAGLDRFDSTGARPTSPTGYTPIRVIRAWIALRRLRPQLLHLHGVRGLCRDWAWAAKLAALPVVWHLHEDLSHPRYRRHLRSLSRLADRTVAVARVQLPFLAPGQAVWIPNGVDPHQFQPPRGSERQQARAEIGLAPEEFAILTLGRICPEKGSFLLLESFKETLRRIPSLRLLIAGEGDPGALERARASAAGATPGRVLFFPPRSEVVGLLHAADLLVLPSRRENCPLVILEAMASGLPVLASQAGEIPFLLDQGRAGAVLPDLTISALAAALERAARGGPPRPNPEASRARARIEAHFTLSRQAEAILDLYRTLIKETVTSEAS